MILINNNKMEQETFPDGTPCVKCLPSGDEYTFTWNFDNMAELFTLKCLHDKFASCKQTLVMPYIPNARMDRVKNPEDTFTLKSFADVINGMHFDKVIVKNAHSNVSLALLDNVQDQGIENDLQMLLNQTEAKVDTFFFPDEGACKRYAELSLVKNYPVLTGMKKRDWKTGKILKLDVLGEKEDIEGKNILIVDDICSRGGTFKFSAIELKKLGAAKIYLYITHCENVIDIPALKEAGIEKVFTTDSICRLENDFVTYIK